MADAEEPAVEQQRVRAGQFLRQAGIVRAVDRREDRVLAVGGAPALADRLHRHAHRVRRLMAGHARAAVGPDRLEEGMALGLDRAVDVQHAQPAEPVGEHQIARQHDAAARLPSTTCAAARGVAGGITLRLEKCHHAGDGNQAERQRAGSHAPAILAGLPRTRAAHGGVAPQAWRRRTYSKPGSALSPGSRPCIFASTGGSMAAAPSRIENLHVRVSAGAARGTCCRPADRSRRHVVVHARQPRRAAAARRPRRRSRRVRRHPAERRRPAARRELDADDALAARVAGPAAPGHLFDARAATRLPDGPGRRSARPSGSSATPSPASSAARTGRSGWTAGRIHRSTPSTSGRDSRPANG